MKEGNHMQVDISKVFNIHGITHISWNLLKKFTKDVNYHLPDYYMYVGLTII